MILPPNIHEMTPREIQTLAEGIPLAAMPAVAEELRTGPFERPDPNMTNALRALLVRLYGPRRVTLLPAVTIVEE